jgi:hypothetical protein
MSEIECLRSHENNGDLLEKYLRKLIKDAGFEAKFVDLRRISSFSPSSPVIAIIDSENLHDFKMKLMSRDRKIIVALNSRKDFKIVSELKSDFNKIFGFIDLSQEAEYNFPVLKNYLELNFTKENINLEKLAENLNEVYELTSTELGQIKSLHDRLVKVRVDPLKGANLSSKFMAGEKSGGEFFEIIQNDQEIVFLQVGSDSYLVSSIILSEIQHLKENSSADLQVRLLQFQKIIKHHANENQAELTYCMMVLNLKTLQVRISQNGTGHIFYQGQFISFDQPIKINFKPRDRLYIISHGANKNWNLLSKTSMKEFFETNQDMNTKDLINEFFFEVSRNKTGTFLVYDALVAAIEIEENVLYQLS